MNVVRLCILLCLLGITYAQNPVAQPVNADPALGSSVGAKLPLVTAGDVLNWRPQGDIVFFDLANRSQIKLSIYSPSIDTTEVGDESYSKTPLEASFTLTHNDNIVTHESFGMTPSDWYTLYEGEAGAGRFALQANVKGKGKNVYYVKLETENGDVALKTYQVTVNAGEEIWRDALTFEISSNDACYIEFYDGDGPEELEARLVQPSGLVQTMSVSEDLMDETRYLPRLPGLYTIQLRLPEGRFQKTNSVRFTVLCNGAPLPVVVTPAAQLDLSNRGEITVDVIDTAGQTLDIPYHVTDTAPRTVTLAEDKVYSLVDIQTETGQITSTGSVQFGFAGGHVTFVLAKQVAIPVPDVRIDIAAPVALELPQPEVEVRRTIPLPTVTVTVQPPALPDFVAGRSFDNSLIACQTTTITLVVENRGEGVGGFSLRERIPAGMTLLDHDGKLSDTELVWRGFLAPGEAAYYSYTLQTTAESAVQTKLGGVLIPDAELDTIFFEDELSRLEFTTLLDMPETLYAGDEVSVQVTVGNPLDRPVTVYLDTNASNRLSLLTIPAPLELLAQGSASTIFRVRAEESGKTSLNVTPFACPLTDLPAAGGPAAFQRLEIVDAPSLPTPRQTTTVVVDMAAYNLPTLDGLVLVEHLPEEVDYIAGSTRVNGVAAEDPKQSGSDLVFELAGSVGQVSFSVLHTGPLILDESHSSLIGLTPEPELLLGRPESLEYYQAAVPIMTEAVVRERVGAVILSPTPDFVLRDRDRVTVSVDTELQADIDLFVNGDLVPTETIGQKVFDPNLNRQTFDYIGVPIVVGPNLIRLESATTDGNVLSDEITIYFAGPASSFSLTPLSPLVADSASDLELDLQVFDAWGNMPANDFLTLEFSGLSPTLDDASTERVGYQVRVENGHAQLRLAPVTEPGEVSVRALLNNELVEERLTVTSNLRDWIVSGVGSAGVSYTDGLSFGVGTSFFARGRILDDYLLTLAANYPIRALGPRDSNPYQQFPVTGSSGTASFDAFSEQGIFARLERDLSYLQYGDFTTNLEGEFLNPGRNYTGLSGEYAGRNFSVRGYSAYVAAGQQIAVDLTSDGTSIRFLPDAPIKPGSLTVEIVKKDALGRVIAEDEDELTRTLTAGTDYRVDEELGLLELYRPVPIQDDAGNRYALRLSYKQPERAEADRFIQFGFQAETVIDTLTLRAGISREQLGSATTARIIAGAAQLQTDNLRGDLEVAYGSNQVSGGVALSTRFLYRSEAFSAEASWRYVSEGYRSPKISSEGNAGNTVTANLSYNIIPEVSVAVGATLTESAGGLTYGANALTSYNADKFDSQFGLSVDNGTLRPLIGANVYDVFAWQGSRFGVTHRQGLSAETASLTSFSVSLPLLENLNLTLTDELIWGQSNAVLVGLEASVNNNQSLASLCRVLGDCDALEPDVNIGTTTLTAQYEIPGGVSADAGSVRLGINTVYPISDELGIDAGVEHIQDLEGSEDSTNLTLGANYNGADLDSSLKYELSWNEFRLKQSVSGGVTFALSDKLFASIDGLFLNDSSAENGFRFGLASAYRGDRVSLLSNTNAQFAALAPSGDNVTGDTRLSWQLSEAVDLRLGYTYNWRFEEGYLDMLSAGSSFYAWQGGNILLQGRFFHDWQTGDTAPGAGIEVSQQLGCGVYGAAGYNVGGLDRDYGAVHNGAGAFLRLDVVFDEEWHCGAAEIGNYVWQDLNSNGLQDEGEPGIAGVRIDLFKANNEFAETLYSDTDGHYTFKRVTPGSYYLRVTPPNDYSFTVMANEPDRNSDVSQQGYTGHFELGLGEQKDIDIGLVGGTP